jgi:hypothetical protein
MAAGTQVFALAQRLGGLPPPMIDQLREAALAGRARRLELLADEVATYSETVSAEIRAFAAAFQYEVLLSALDLHAHHES